MITLMVLHCVLDAILSDESIWYLIDGGEMKREIHT